MTLRIWGHLNGTVNYVSIMLHYTHVYGKLECTLQRSAQHTNITKCACMYVTVILCDLAIMSELLLLEVTVSQRYQRRYSVSMYAVIEVIFRTENYHTLYVTFT